MTIATLGSLTILLIFLMSLVTVGLSAVGARRGSPRLAEAGVQGLYATFGLSAFASSLIIYSFLAGDYSVQYVQHTSDSAMPLFYKITAFWGGLDGSLLFWVLLHTLFASLAVHANRERHRELIPHVVAVLSAITAFFASLLLFVKDPFAPYLLEVPTTGRGLNPLLQNFYMIFHPPSLYLGYVSLAVPYAFGMAALLTGQVDAAWQRSVRRWVLFSWIFLSIGLILGGLWAYEELGWGGYWAWDPVENAGLLPWFTTVAFLHSVMIQERRGMMKVWNLVLIIVSFLLTIIGTFMTRSGVVQSVHAFGEDPTLAWTFGGFMLAIVVFSFGLLRWRLPLLRARGELESALSREFAFLVNNWLFLVCALFVLFATMWPTFIEWLNILIERYPDALGWIEPGERKVIGPPFFNRYMRPLGLALLLLTGVGPLLAWRKTSGENLVRQFAGPLVVGVASTVAPAVLGIDSPWGLACFGLCGFTFWTIVQEFYRGVALRRQKRAQGVMEALVGLVLRARRRYGGYIIHLGVVMMFLGWAGNAYKIEKKAQLQPGMTYRLGDYEIRHDGLRVTEDWQKEMITADLAVLKDGQVLDVLHPARWWYYQQPEMATTEVSRYMTPGEDVYASMQEVDLTTGWTQLSLFINPLVNWIWAGMVVMLAGSLICVGTRRTEASDE
ncbi:MAG TPA: heme lyase CcmF/NrfE family subunit [Nannocystaceae bacterium]|nr:heme lyase CcmF/NrfE family subunit [Nannocystaceae bacterium]